MSCDASTTQLPTNHQPPCPCLLWLPATLTGVTHHFAIAGLSIRSQEKQNFAPTKHRTTNQQLVVEVSIPLQTICEPQNG